MTFYTFMTRFHLEDENPRGDLARDMKRDRERFPRNGNSKYAGWHRLIADYLAGEGACSGCMEAFEESWKEYLAYEGKGN